MLTADERASASGTRSWERCGAVLGHATSTRRSADACRKGKHNPTKRADQSAYIIEFSFMLESLHVGRHLVSANILTARSIFSPTSLFSETSDAVSPSRGPWAVAGAEHPSCTHRNKVEDCDRNHHRPSEKRSTKSTPLSRLRQHRSSDETTRITSPGIIPPFTPREWRGISIGTR